MSTTEVGKKAATSDPSAAKVPMKLEVVAIPVSDVDRATGTVSGTPTATGYYRVTVYAQDTGGGVGEYFFEVNIN